ncbi:SPX-domain-containing protein [Thozetella sp. PMI_491]|nr:SPX-domain-containing protein [Thozetella sp. PMI_491]
MKYGEQFERESVPGWSLHNIDYNSLKHHIKVHTTKDQATAIAIPGHQDVALSKFEDELFAELCRQHDRVDLFVRSKADEISRRLLHLSSQIRQLMLRCATRSRVSPKRQRKFSKYETELLHCGDDIQALKRFINAQVVAFRKILKKYRKWTGSSTLGSRFRDTILSHPKSFTKRDLAPQQAQYEDLLATLRAATPASVDGAATPAAEPATSNASPREERDNLPVIETHDGYFEPDAGQPQGYWNEYDYGSEAGDLNNPDGGYAIYIDPNQEPDFLGVATLVAFFTMPVKKLNGWMAARKNIRAGEQGPLLPTHTGTYGTVTSLPDVSYNTDTEDETVISPGRNRRSSYGYASSEDFPSGYEAHYASLPSINDQRMALYRERVLAWGTVASFTASLILLTIAAALILTGRHKLRLEVDAGVTIGVMTSLLFACAAIGMTLLRHATLGWLNRIAIWATFFAICILNGMLLVLVSPVFHYYLQAYPKNNSIVVLGPEASGELFNIGSTIQSTNTSQYINIGSESTSYKSLTFGKTASTAAWGLEGDTIITTTSSSYGRQLNFVACKLDNTYWQVYFQTGSATPTGTCSNYQSLHLPCLC